MATLAARKRHNEDRRCVFRRAHDMGAIFFPHGSAPVVAAILVKIPAPSFAAFVAVSPVIVAVSVLRAIAASSVAPRVLNTVASAAHATPRSLRTVSSTLGLRRTGQH
jgi:hypothetical protein